MNFKNKGQSDEWDKDLFYISQTYGVELANKLNDLIDEGKIEEVNLIIKYLK